MPKWVVLLDIYIEEGFLFADRVILVDSKETAGKIVSEFLSKHRDKDIALFKITEEAVRDA